MKLQTKLNRAEANLIKYNGFTSEEAKTAINKTLEFVDLEKYTVKYFCNFLINTYNVEGVER